MDTPQSLVIRKQNKFRRLTTPKAYKKGDVICSIPTDAFYDKREKGFVNGLLDAVAKDLRRS